MSLILNIDTSLQTASVSLSLNGTIIHLAANSVQKDHAAFLHPAIKNLLAEQQILIKELNAVCCTAGPGSYTGLRVGLAAAKGLSFALHIPLITISTLAAMAQAAIIANPEKQDYYFCPMIDARRMEVFTGLYDVNLNMIKEPHARVLDKNSFETELKHKKIIFFGNGAEKWKEMAQNEHAFFSDLSEIHEAINMLSYKKFKVKEFTPVSTAVPLYTKEFYNK